MWNQLGHEGWIHFTELSFYLQISVWFLQRFQFLLFLFFIVCEVSGYREVIRQVIIQSVLICALLVEKGLFCFLYVFFLLAYVYISSFDLWLDFFTQYHERILILFSVNMLVRLFSDKIWLVLEIFWFWNRHCWLFEESCPSRFWTI